MIISHRHKYIFFAVPKTATHTIRRALSSSLGPNDWEQQDLFAKRRLPIPAVAAIQHGHISVAQIRPHLSDEQWRTYFKFAFVRNPFDRFVSTCFFLHRNNPGFEPHARQFMRQAIVRPRFQGRILARPQAELLVDANGVVAMDFVGRYETLDEDFEQVCKHLGLEPTDLTRNNTSKHHSYQSYYDESLKAAVAQFYRSDLERFGYRFEVEN